MMVRRTLFLGLAALLVVAIGGALLFWAAKRAEPHYAGEILLAGPAAPITVRYGAHAVPSIEAESLRDLLFAQGYVVASERMWQMDLLRRLASGRLAEVLGEEALQADRFFRTIGLAKAAREGLDALDGPHREMLEAYAAGVNAYQERAAGRLPLEYLIASFEPAPWTPEDSLVIGEYLAWTLSFNLRSELVFLRLAARVGNERAAELFPSDEGIPAPDDAADLPSFTAASATGIEGLLALPASFGLPTPGAASNAWAVTGERTADGGALLANDTHLAPTLPGIWYELEMRAPGFHAAGVALPGVPLVLIGHNDDLAWGLTTVMADTQDLFVERPTPDGDRVARPGGAEEAIVSRQEEIAVRGHEEPHQLTVRSTGHGVILNEVLGANTGTLMDLEPVDTGHLLALRWNSDIPERALAGVFGLNTASTLEEARAASLELKRASFNLMAAHRNGGIAWQVTGALPRRGRGSGVFPSPGWEPGYGWEGYVPQTDNPGIANPRGYALITANNRTVPEDFRPSLGHAWMAPFRARRIEELIGQRIALTPRDMTDMQLDHVSLEARRFKESLGRVAPDIRLIDPEARRIADEYLMTWEGDFEPESRAAALFVLIRQFLFEELFGDELGEDLPALLSVALLSYNALEAALYSGRSSFWDNVDTAEAEGPAHVWARALRRAKSVLDETQPELGKQRLDRLRHLSFPHAFDRTPLLGDFFGLGPLPMGGDTHTINTLKTSPDDPGTARFIPTLRVVYAPADWTQTEGTLTLGQSGHRFSRYRDDQLEDWRAGHYHPWLWFGPDPGDEIGVLTLKPTPDRPAP